MSKRTKLLVRQREIRARLAELSEKDKPTDEESAEMRALTTESIENDTKLNALDAAPKPAERRADGRDPHVVALEERADVGRVVDAVRAHAQVDGAEAELQQHYGLDANMIPLELLRPEERAVTTAPSEVNQQQAAIVPPVFATGVASFLGIDMPTVGMGDAVYPVLTNRPTVGGPHTDSSAVAETTGMFTASVLSPSRIQASFFWRRTDAARFSGMDSALRSALSEALSEKVDQQIVNGTNGLLNGTVLTDHDASAETTFAAYLSDLLYGRVDGRFADTAAAMRIVMGSAAYAHAAATYQGTTDTHALQRLNAESGGVRVSAHVPAAASKKQNVLIRRGMRRDYVAPMWRGVTLIPDEVTKAGSGEIVLTAVLLFAAKLLRADGFYKQQVQVA